MGEELKRRSSPDRLPHVMEGIGDACSQLQTVLTSPQFLARVGDSFPELPSLNAMNTRVDSMRTNGGVFIEDVDESESNQEMHEIITIGFPEDGWVSWQAAGGRTFWHHTSLGPPPWDGMPTETAPWPDATSDASLAEPAVRVTSKNLFGLADGELGLNEPGQGPKTSTE